MVLKQTQFDAIVNAYSVDLYRYLIWLCGNTQLAEDISQETFFRAWRGLDKLQDPKAIKSWLFTIARRELARHFEKNKTIMESLDEIHLAAFGDADPALDPDVFSLRQALSRLPLPYREPLVLQVIAGYSGNEIAEILQVQVNTVMTRLFRARKLLAQALTPASDEKGFK